MAIRLAARDGAGQTTTSEDARVTLPERVFRHPVARKVIEQRKRLTTEPERRDAIADALRMLSLYRAPTRTARRPSSRSTAAHSRLGYEPGDAALDSVTDLLWDTALGIEDGELSIAERELRRAQQDLMEALARNAPDAELERLMDALQRAPGTGFMRELAQQMQERPDGQQALPFDPNQRLLQSTDLQRVLQQIRELMRSGARDAARQMLAALQNMLGKPARRKGTADEPPGASRKSGAAPTARVDRTTESPAGPEFPAVAGRRAGGPASRIRGRGPRHSREIREALRRLREALRQMGMQPGQAGTQSPGRAFEDADRNMGDSTGALDRNAPGDSVAPQGRAHRRPCSAPGRAWSAR